MPGVAGPAEAPEVATPGRGGRPRFKARRRMRSPSRLVLAVFVAWFMVFGTVAADIQATEAALSAAGAALSTVVDLLGLDSLEAAERSLADGQGPAQGASLNCTLSDPSLSGQCSAPPIAPAADPTPDSPHYCAVTKQNVQLDCQYWSSLIQPAPRTGMAMTYDVKDKFVLAFGGWNGVRYLNDTWSFTHDKWVPLSPPVSPTARAGAALAYDKKDGYVVLFGGHDATSILNDTWKFSGNSWSLLAPASSPSPRTDASLVYDSVDGYLVLFGGWNGVTTLSSTWKFVGGTWSLIVPPAGGGGKSTDGAPAGGNPSQPPGTPPLPPGREDAGMTFDVRDNMVVLFGGLNVSSGGSRYLNDTWDYVGGRWTSLTTAYAPPARSQAVFVFDPIDNYSVLFGGGNGSAAVEFDDTWTFVSGAWTLMTPGTPQGAAREPAASAGPSKSVAVLAPPSAREGAAATWDVGDRNLTLFSGEEEGLPTVEPDTWEFSFGHWFVDTATPQYSWPNPSARYGASMVFDLTASPDPVDVLFGGTTFLGANGETWEFRAQDWAEVDANPSPPARSFASMVFDAHDGYVLLFGGRSAGGAPLGDTWTFQDNVWTQLSPATSPPARYGGAMAYDYADSYVVLFGGVATSGSDLGDTWTFAGGSWTQLAPPSSPSPRGYAEMTYDSRDGYAVLYGGLSGTTLLSDTWEYVAGGWSNITGVGVGKNPTPRWGSVFTFDPANNVVLLFGGCAEAVDPLQMTCTQPLNDTWRFAKGVWGQVPEATLNASPPPLVGAEFANGSFSNNGKGAPFVLLQGGYVGGPAAPLADERWLYTGLYTSWYPPLTPSPREGAEMQYERPQDHLLLFGGYGPVTGGGLGYLGDTWMWDTDQWTPILNARYSPSPRAFGSIAWDPQADQVVYFGGYGPSGYLGDTWAWLGGPTTGDWHEIQTVAAPPARANESMAYTGGYNASDGYLILFGGQNATTVFGDTWEYVGAHVGNNFTGNWTQLRLSPSPSPREGAAMAFDVVDGYLVLFGGRNGATVFGDTWEFVNGAWVAVHPAKSPPARFAAAEVDDHWDANDSRNTSGVFPNAALVLFGGETGAGTYLNDTWVFSAGQWVYASSTTDSTFSNIAPPASAYSAIACDEQDGNVELFGGFDGYPMGGFYTFW
jgi:hypothetical protein